MQGSDVTTRVEVALPTLLPVRKLGRMQGGREGPLHSKQDGGCVFRTSRSPSFVFMQTFPPFLLLTDKIPTAVKVIYLLIKKKIQCSLYFSVHSEWRYSLVFTSVSSSRRCWSLDLAWVCLFVMSSYTPPFFVVFSHLAFPWLFFLFWAESDGNA